MLLKDSRRRKFSKLVAHHVFRDKDGVKDFPVMHEEGMTYEIGGNRGSARPSLDRFFDRAFIHLVDFLEQVLIDEWTFF